MVTEATKISPTNHSLCISLIIALIPSHLINSFCLHFQHSVSPPFFLSSSLSSSSYTAPTGWNVTVWASVNCGLSAVVSSRLKAQSQQAWSVGRSCLPLH